jgi:hypothetical protein
MSCGMEELVIKGEGTEIFMKMFNVIKINRRFPEE